MLKPEKPKCEETVIETDGKLRIIKHTTGAMILEGKTKDNCLFMLENYPGAIILTVFHGNSRLDAVDTSRSFSRRYDSIGGHPLSFEQLRRTLIPVVALPPALEDEEGVTNDLRETALL